MPTKKQVYKADEEIWDKLTPLTFGTKVRIVKNLVLPGWRNERWFQARNLAIGKIGYIEGDTYDSSLFIEYFKYKYKTKESRIYEVFLPNPVLGFQTFSCVRKELEIVEYV